jgi:multidrug efflux pump subunit AcrA (membrane-fusion protein)
MSDNTTQTQTLIQGAIKELQALNDDAQVQLDKAQARVAELQAQIAKLQELLEQPSQKRQEPVVAKKGETKPDAAEAVALADAAAAAEEEAEPGALAVAAAAAEDRAGLVFYYLFLFAKPGPVDRSDLIAILTSLVSLKPSPREISSTLRMLMEDQDPTPFQKMFENLAEKSQIMTTESATMKATPEFAKAEMEFVQVAVDMYRWVSERVPF